MSDTYDHLVPEAVRWVHASPAARFRFIERDKVIPTPQFELASGRVFELYDHERILRPPNLALVGVSGIGKSMILEECADRHRPRRHRTSGELKVPILHVEHPPLPGPHWYARTLAKGLGYGVKLPQTNADRFELILERLEEAEVRLIIVEEINQIYEWPRMHVQEFYGLTRWLSNESKIPQVISGTHDVLKILDGDIQLVRRFERLELKPFALDETFAGFVAAYVRTIPLRYPTDIDRSFIERAHEAGQGITDTTVKALQRAGKRAILSGTERILREHIHIDSTAIPPVVERPGRRGRKRRVA